MPLGNKSLFELKLPQQAGKLTFFGTRPNWVVSCIAYTNFHSPRPVFHSPGQIFTRIGERASGSFPACPDLCHHIASLGHSGLTLEMPKISHEIPSPIELKILWNLKKCCGHVICSHPSACSARCWGICSNIDNKMCVLPKIQNQHLEPALCPPMKI